jgi:prepilin signal peptidase PulO-like enzyme (type II secretory pathway)
MPTGYIETVAFALGAVIGSFLNVVILRMNTGAGLGGRSMCMSCGKELHWYELVPVVSFLALRGRCAGCRARISWQYPAVELATGALFALIAWRYFSPTGLIYAVACSILVVIAAYDMRHKIIPDRWVYAFDAVALASVFIGGPAVFHAPHIWTLLAGPVLALPFAALWALSKGKWIGLGDSKLILGLGWILGMNGGANALVLAFWIGAVVGVAWMLVVARGFKRHMEIPFGPFLILGALIVLFTGVTVIDLRILPFLF